MQKKLNLWFTKICKEMFLKNHSVYTKKEAKREKEKSKRREILIVFLTSKNTFE